MGNTGEAGKRFTNMITEKEHGKRVLFLKTCLDRGISYDTTKALSSKIKDAKNPEKLAEEYTTLIENCRTEAEILQKLNL